MLVRAPRLVAVRQAPAQRRSAPANVRTMASSDPGTAAPPSTTAPELRNAGPDPKRFTVAEGQLTTVASAAFAALARLGTGGFAFGYTSGLRPDGGDGSYAVASVGGRQVSETSEVASFPRPAQPLQLYEFQGCPFCRKVREAVSVLDLDVDVFPCPKGGTVWRPKAVELGGKAQFPFLVDPNSGRQMYESDDIINYLFDTYGPGRDKVPLSLRLGAATTISCGLALAPRAGAGSRASPSRQPAQPLVLWGYELSPFVVIVKEVLSELELPYTQVTCSRGSPKRQLLLQKRGAFQVPYLEDPAAGVYLFESSAIVQYLRNTYGLAQGTPAPAATGDAAP